MDIRILTADTKELEDEWLYRRLYSSVSRQRREKADRMRFMKDKCLSLGAGVLLETALREAGVRDIHYSEEANGKPCLSSRQDIRFNISHSGTKVLCALSDHDIGCDVERIRDKCPEVAEHFFFREEYEALQKVLSGQIADPENQADPEKSLALAREYESQQKVLDGLMEKWEALMEAIG